MATFTSHSPSETQELGESWGRQAQPGWVIGLSGDLGAGKTKLAKGLASGLGIKEPVLSPTFALLHQYLSGRLPLFHLDLYRLETQAQIVGAGLEEYFYRPRGVAVIEWIERWNAEPRAWIKPGASEPLFYRHVTFEQISEEERLIHYEDFGA